ncbi:hypothetical protein ACI2LM_15925 [Paenibacillus lautus]|uniref:hypothetical protein n=1 Tax=Paenibacillus lautus TaxID=1401 RepID=UPI00384ACF10
MNYPKYPDHPICEHCERALENWSGNIMVDTRDYPDKIDTFHVWCKECTTDLDKRGVGRRFHNIWELSWFKKTYFDLEREVLEELKEENPRWGIEALMKFNDLGRMVYGVKPARKEDENL